MSRPSSICLTFSLLAFCLPAMSRMARAQCDAPVLSVHVDSMVARDTGAEIDQRLGPEAGRLQALFDYSSYQLLRTDEADTRCGKQVEFILPDERILHVLPVATHGNLIALELVLFAGARAVMRTQLKMPKGGLLVLVGSRSPQEASITSLRVDALGEMPVPGALATAHVAPTPLPLGEKPVSTR